MNADDNANGETSSEHLLLYLRPEHKAPIQTDIHGRTDVGCRRDHNEDSFIITELRRSLRVLQSSRPEHDANQTEGPYQGWLMIVADGMGGHAAGEVASAMTIDLLTNYALSEMPWKFPDQRSDIRRLAEDLRNAVDVCQGQLIHASERRKSRAGMGTTLTLAYVTWPNLYAVHVGDSRLYAYRNESLHQVTNDHTLAQQLVENQVLAPEDAEESEFSHVLINALGGDSKELKIELHHALLGQGDILLVCSDGLTKHVTTEELETILTDVHNGTCSAAKATDRMIERAKEEGGTDNITAIVARFGEDKPTSI